MALLGSSGFPPLCLPVFKACKQSRLLVSYPAYCWHLWENSFMHMNAWNYEVMAHAKSQCCGCHIGEANFSWWNQKRFWEEAASEMILKDDHLLTVREWRENISDKREDSMSTHRDRNRYSLLKRLDPDCEGPFVILSSLTFIDFLQCFKPCAQRGW